MPFRFGVVTLTAAPQAFVRARIRLADGTGAEGMAAELMAPKWFDKNPELSNEDNFDQLRNALRIARETVPADVSINLTGSAKFFQDSTKALPILLLITILVIYGVLAILYEHFGHPITILTALPLAGLGAPLPLAAE
jgi:hypothetical protein